MTSARFSFCNDCDLMDRRGFEEVHEYLDALGLPAGDSFWLFDPSGGEMGLFTHDADHPGPQHRWLLDQLNGGRIDVLHSSGSYGERFNRGFRPDRTQLAKALEYVAKHARVPHIWTNHGDQFNTQNIGGRLPAAHHGGDLPGSPSYCLDLLVEYGIEYFWLDRLLVRDPAQVYRVVARERCRDGRSVATFARYFSAAVEWSGNAQNFADQLRAGELETMAAQQQDTVLYTHWGCHHVDHYAVTPDPPVLTANSRHALEEFANAAARIGLEVVPLETLLDGAAARPVAAEIDRIGRITVRSEQANPDAFYFNQYHKHGFDYFQRRIDAMQVSGARALDAGCGVGQWSYALRAHFAEVHGTEINPAAVAHLSRLAGALRWTDGPVFSRGSIEQLPYRDAAFDFVCCYGVLFVTAIRRSLDELRRVLAPGGRVYLCVNGDGWYEYLCDERFAAQPLESILQFAQPLWNAMVARAGGEDAFNRISRTELAPEADSFWNDAPAVRARLIGLTRASSGELASLLGAYSDRVIQALARITRAHLDSLAQHDHRSGGVLTRVVRRWLSPEETGAVATEAVPACGIGSTNRPFTPAEFSALAASSGFAMLTHGPDAALAPGVTPIYAGRFNGHESVWECMLAAR